MALTKENIVDKLEIVEDGSVQIRKATVIKEDGTELSRTFERYVLHPSTKTGDTWGDTDISTEDDRTKAICTATWTDSVKTDYQTLIDSINSSE
jgi:hypothetical protein